MKKITLFAAALLATVSLTHAAPLPMIRVAATTPPNKINLNKADASTITGSVKGIGKKRAEAIVAYRDSHQGFKTIDELAQVKGIGQHFVDTHKQALEELYTLK
ncbi:MAG: competence protein ComEA [Legionella sp. 40-6]|nr:helix-hairpin-helix domain-containing protein [Legionella sp.]OJX96225.1 MAG: competence protein ComEA [Legionella sp. 40-6]